jgi:hypothetical protein
MQLLQWHELLCERLRWRLGYVPEWRTVLVCLCQQSEVAVLRLDQLHRWSLHVHNSRWTLLLVRHMGGGAGSTPRLVGPLRAAIAIGSLVAATAASVPETHAALLLALLLLSACVVALAQQTLP